MRRISHKAWEFYWDQPASKELTHLIIAYRHALMEEFDTVVKQGQSNWELIPGLNSLALHFKSTPSYLISQHLEKIQAWEQDFRTKVDLLGIEGSSHLNWPTEVTSDVSTSRWVELPIVYDGVDIDAVAAQTQLSSEEVIQLHLSSEYLVALMGFQKGFPYMLGLDSRLKLARKSTPNKRVPRGSVAIAEEMCGVYPNLSPGGWHLLGRTDLKQLALLKLGDRVKFNRVETIHVD